MSCYNKSIDLIKLLLVGLADDKSESIGSIDVSIDSRDNYQELYEPILKEFFNLISISINDIKKKSHNSLSKLQIENFNFFLGKSNSDKIRVLFLILSNLKKSFNDFDFSLDNIVNVIQKFQYKIEDYFFPSGEEIKLFQYKIEDNIGKSIIRSCIKDKSRQYVQAKIEILIKIFNALATSVLKAEYIIFSDYSKELDELTSCFHVGYIEKVYREDNEKKLKERSFDFIDANLLKSLMSSIWYLIELCKKNSFHDCQHESNNTLVILNGNHRERASRIFNYESSFCFVSTDILSSFQSAFESLIDITTIDHHYNYSIDNFNKLFLSIERIDSLKRTLLQNLENSCIDDSVNAIINTDDGREFDIILEIIKFKAKVLLSQYVKYYYVETTGEDFSKKYEFIAYGYDKNIAKQIENYCREISANEYAKYQEDVINHFQASKPKEDTFNFLKNDTSGRYYDIIKFNNTSKESIELFDRLSEIKRLCEENNIRDVKISEKKIKEITDKIDKEKNTIIKNPRFFTNFMDYLKDVINESKTSSVNVAFSDSQKMLLDSCFSIFVSLKREMDKYFNYDFDYSTLRYQVPFQYCFYEFIEYITTKEEKSYQIIEGKAKPYLVNEDFITNYGKNGCQQDKDFFFFASAGLVPLNINQLKDKHRDYGNDMVDLQNKINTIMINKTIEEKFKEYDRDFEKTVISERNKSVSKIAELRTDFDNKTESVSNRTVTLLGILGSFLAFTTLTIGTIRAVDNIAKFILFTTTYLIAVISFVFCIKLLVVRGKDECVEKGEMSEKDRNNGKDNKNIKRCNRFTTNRCVIIIMAVFIIIDVILCIWKNDQIFDSPKVEETSKPNVTNNTIQLDLSNQESPTIIKDVERDTL